MLYQVLYQASFLYFNISYMYDAYFIERAQLKRYTWGQDGGGKLAESAIMPHILSVMLAISIRI